ncbi:pilus assembly protein TadG-related protein [Asticcacaulis sp. ZE23SCel15]|uniref:pilus assembly protein TadG-related protein n=1 Tax=Asticcacaulis sp. ZE23SCel15 TaxID=3059027 RepID=UPI00265E50E7|nr:pilus assembly protein TadG-related protein [Asticcacaulis sp. ZE23SCel15]WKL56228.1 pilus assembly protein TadG-related protein [Asticcacaulis sp. ZE23SCel15]
MFRRFFNDERGASAIIMALSMSMVICLAALAVDVGSIFLHTRKLQGAADLAAMTAAADLSRADAAASATVATNLTGTTTVTEIGQYDQGLKPGNRFKTTALTSANAARVTLTAQAPLYFGQVLLDKPSITISRKATASQTQLAAFSIGSRLASLNGGLLNSLLSGLTGSSVSLTVMDYNHLVSARVDLLSYVSALHETVTLDAASFDDTLNAEVKLGDALNLLADEVDLNARGPLKVLAATNIKDTKIKLNDLIDLGVYGDQDYIKGASDSAVSVDSLSLVNAMLTTANKNRQVELNLSSEVPSLSALKVWLAIGERPNASPWITVTRSGEPIIRTAQTRLYVEASIGGVGSVLSALGVKALKLPVFIELASGEAKLASITCTGSKSVTLSVRPSIGQVNIGEINVADLNNFKKTLTVNDATLVNISALGIPVISATAKAQIKLGGETWKSQAFTAHDIKNHTIKTVKTDDAVQSLTQSLVDKVDLTVVLAGIKIKVGPAVSAIGSLLSFAAPLIDGVLNTLLGTLGIGLGEADVQVHGLRCSGAALVS